MTIDQTLLMMFVQWNFTLINDALKVFPDISHFKMIARAKTEMQKDCQS